MIYESAEVVDTSKAYKTNQKGDDGEILPLGAIKVKIQNYRGVGNVDSFYARPFGYIKTLPLVGEHVMVFKGPIGDLSDPFSAFRDWYYLPNPLNVNNDSTYNVLQHSFYRGKVGLDDPIVPTKPGETFPFPPKPTDFRQYYEGDTIIQSRFNASARFGSTVKGNLKAYDKKPTWEGSVNGDPLIIFAIKNPISGPDTLPPEFTKDKTQTREIGDSGEYDVEDIGLDLSSIYMTSSQRLPKLKLGRPGVSCVKKVTKYDKPMIVLDSHRIVLNAKEDDIYLIAKGGVCVTGSKIKLVTNEHNVDVDEFVDIVHDLVKEVKNLTTSTAMFTTLVGPTGPATNAAKLLRLFFRIKRLKVFIRPVSLSTPPIAPNYKLGTDGIVKNSFSSPPPPAESGGPSAPTSKPQSDGPLSISTPSDPAPPSTQDGTSQDDIPTFIVPVGESVSIPIEYDEICVSSKSPNENLGGGACAGRLFVLKGTISSLNEDNIFEDSVYLLKVEAEQCEKGWYTIGSERIHKIKEEDIKVVYREDVLAYYPKFFIDSTALKELVTTPVYKDCFYIVEFELIDLERYITLI